MRRIVMVALLLAACGGSDGSSSSAPACTAGAVRCARVTDMERCSDPNGAGNVQWHTTVTCTGTITHTDGTHDFASVPCIPCVDGALECYVQDVPACTSHGGLAH